MWADWELGRVELAPAAADRRSFRAVGRGRSTGYGAHVWLAAVALGGCLGIARDVKACVTLPPPTSLVGFPADGEVGVPTDVVPFYSTLYAKLEDVAGVPFTLTSADGETVEVTAMLTYEGTFELFPERELAPDTEYTLAATLNLEFSSPETLVERATFTTGSRAAPVPEAPAASLQHYRLAEPPKTSCSPWEAGTCVALRAGLPVVASDIDEFGQEIFPTVYTASFMTNISGVDQGTSARCVRLRARAANGALSEPTELCRDDGPTITIEGENVGCTADGLTQGAVEPSDTDEPDPEPESPPETAPEPGVNGGTAPAADATSEGCSVAAPVSRTTRGFGYAVTLALLGVIATRRQRRQRNAPRTATGGAAMTNSP